MNDNHIRQIFGRYIQNFEMINDKEHCEYYKWQIVKTFRVKMDDALAAPFEEFAEKLYEIKKVTENLIDSYTQPFFGLVKFARKSKENAETIQTMFRELYAEDGGNITLIQNKVREFLKKSRMLMDPSDGYLYKNDMHSVTTYLFLYDPEHNYIFKATNALAFADCIEFYDDWGSGDEVKLDVYYRMCDQIVGAIMKSKELLSTDASRFQNGWGVDPSTLYEDANKHLLAFDIIYCCTVYHLFDGITFERHKTKERQLVKEKKEKAATLYAKCIAAREKAEKLQKAKEYLDAIYVPGRKVRHAKYGDGTVVENSGTIVTIDFVDGGWRKLGIIQTTGNGTLSVSDKEYSDKIAEYADLLKKENAIRIMLGMAEREFAPYAEYLD